MPVPEDISEVEFFHPGNDLVPGLCPVVVSVAVIVMVERREDAVIPVPDGDSAFLSVEDSANEVL